MYYPSLNLDRYEVATSREGRRDFTNAPRRGDRGGTNQTHHDIGPPQPLVEPFSQ